MVRKTVSDLSVDELKELLEAVLTEGFEKRMVAALSDPNLSPELKDVVQELLQRQQRAAGGGERGRSLDELLRELGSD